MDRMLFLAMSGAKQTMVAQGVNTNNLANIGTTGFKQDLEQFRSQPVFGPGFPVRVYAMTERPTTDTNPGPLNITHRDLDVAVRGEGWIAVQAKDGSEAYTRAGDLRVDAAGILTTGNGLPVLGVSGAPIVVPQATKIEIASDGSISIQPIGQNPNTLAQIEPIKLVKPPLDNLYKADDGLMHTINGEPAEPDLNIRLISGALEGSNVNAVEAMVNMIELARTYEAQVKMMRTAKENDESVSQLMRMS